MRAYIGTLLEAFPTEYADGIAPDLHPSSFILHPSPEPLTSRELDVLRLLAAGHGNQQIAAELIIAVSTVRSHVKSIYGKLGVGNRVQAIARARSLGLLPA